MTEQSEYILDNIRNIQSLRDSLRSEMAISDPQEGEVTATIKVYNDTPQSPDGGNIVFVGVGLRFIDGREKGRQKGSAYWPKRIKKSRPSDQPELRQQYSEGYWFGRGGSESSFPDVTGDEQSHGEVLFPGETVVYDIEISETDLPYLDIKVEGSVSRRHLLRTSKSMHDLKERSWPIVNETFINLDKIDFLTPLINIVNEIPDIGPQTTFADIDKLKAVIEKGRTHINGVVTEIKDIQRAAPNQKMREYIEKGIRQYLKSVAIAFESAQKALSSGDMEKIKEAVVEIKEKLLETDEFKRRRAELISQFGINA